MMTDARSPHSADPWWLPHLALPCCGTVPELRDAAGEGGQVTSGTLGCPACGADYPIEDGIVRLAGETAYADSFGFEWQEFKTTQVDHLNGTTISRDWLTQIAGGSLDVFDGAVTYDAGCGSGRFSAVAAGHGARVIAVDLGLGAVRACRDNLQGVGEAICVHADARRSPIRPASVDVAMSVGVYQHTPEPLEYVKQVAQAVRPGGTMVFWGYERRLRSLMHPKYVLRPVTKRVDERRLLRMLRRMTPRLLRLSDRARALPGGKALARLVPVANRGSLPLDAQQVEEWSVLDTFDWLSPAYDHPRPFGEVAAVLEDTGFAVTRTVWDSVGCRGLRAA